MRWFWKVMFFLGLAEPKRRAKIHGIAVPEEEREEEW